MSLLDSLRALGGTLGLIQVLPRKTESAPLPAKVTARSVTLEQLTTEVRAEEVRVLAELPAELTVEFDKVFDAAGIKPPVHGWNIERLQKLLDTDQYRAMDRESAQRAILGLLSAVKADVEDLVKDAIARDQAIDKYEAFVHQKMNDRVVARQHKISELEEQARSLEKERARLLEEMKADQERWQEWRKKKIECEEAMARAIGYLIDRPVVTIDRTGTSK
jgi:hypothetical protein